MDPKDHWVGTYILQQRRELQPFDDSSGAVTHREHREKPRKKGWQDSIIGMLFLFRVKLRKGSRSEGKYASALSPTLIIKVPNGCIKENPPSYYIVERERPKNPGTSGSPRKPHRNAGVFAEIEDQLDQLRRNPDQMEAFQKAVGMGGGGGGWIGRCSG